MPTPPRQTGKARLRRSHSPLPWLLAALLLLGAGPARATPVEDDPKRLLMSGPGLSWDYPEFSTAQWITTGLSLGVTIAMQLFPTAETKLRRGLLVDDDVRDALAVHDLKDQRTVRTISDALLTVMAAYPFLVDSLGVAAWYRRSPTVAKQMALINAQTMAVSIGVMSVVKVATNRERPYGQTCGGQRPDTQFDCEDRRRYRSFFSGHSSTAFTSAGLLCMHHMYLDLYGSRAADIGTCAAAMGVAATTGTLRIVADQHYFTDVLLGAAVGTLTGLGLPWVLHYRHGKTGRSSASRGNRVVEAQLVPLANGIALSGTFDEDAGLKSAERGRLDTLGLDPKASPVNPWSTGRARLFVATRLDIGFLYFKPLVSLGYGRPHHTWLGLDIKPLVSFEHAGVWGGLRGTMDWIALKLGARYQYSWVHALLDPRQSYSHDDIENRANDGASYISLEAELSADFPLGPGDLLGEVAGTYILGVDDGYHVYEDTLKLVADPPWVWRARLGYIYPLDNRRVFRVGLIAEVAGVPNRRSHTVRGGLVGSVRLMPNLEARLTVMPVWTSDDDLGSAGSDILMLGVRHRWASGTPLFQ